MYRQGMFRLLDQVVLRLDKITEQVENVHSIVQDVKTLGQREELQLNQLINATLGSPLYGCTLTQLLATIWGEVPKESELFHPQTPADWITSQSAMALLCTIITFLATRIDLLGAAAILKGKFLKQHFCGKLFCVSCFAFGQAVAAKHCCPGCDNLPNPSEKPEFYLKRIELLYQEYMAFKATADTSSTPITGGRSENVDVKDRATRANFFEAMFAGLDEDTTPPGHTSFRNRLNLTASGKSRRQPEDLESGKVDETGINDRRGGHRQRRSNFAEQSFHTPLTVEAQVQQTPPVSVHAEDHPQRSRVGSI